VISAPESHFVVLEALHKAGVPTVEAEIAMIPKTPMKVDAKHVGGMLRMLEVMEDHDDTQNVYTNFDYDEDAANG
jgi:transcriptional/translational regulatory protein YebC/TACO1